MATDDSQSGTHSTVNRRSVLKTMGASAVAGTALTGTASANHIDVWFWHTPDVDSQNGKNAHVTIEDAIEQIGRTGDFDVHDQGELSGNWPTNGTYGDYKEEFDQQRPFTYEGDVHFLVYWDGLIDGWSWDTEAAAGKAWGSLKSSNTPVCIANEDLNDYDTTSYQNIVMHEFLHPMLDGSYAPDYGNEHSFGAQKGWLCENTPMLTGYAESNRGGNEKPDRCCNKDTVDTCDYHTGTLSDCTVDEANRWLDDEY